MSKQIFQIVEILKSQNENQVHLNHTFARLSFDKKLKYSNDIFDIIKILDIQNGVADKIESHHYYSLVTFDGIPDIITYDQDSPVNSLDVQISTPHSEDESSAIAAITIDEEDQEEQLCHDDQFFEEKSTPTLNISTNRCLPFANIKLGNKDSKRLPECNCLIDSGATDSFLSSKIFKGIPNNSRYIIGQCRIDLITASGAISTEATQVEVPITLTDNKNHEHVILWKFLVTDHLNQEAYLGFDFISSTFCHCLTKTFLNLSPIQGRKLVQVPLLRLKNGKSVNLIASYDTIIPANSMHVIDSYAEEPISYFHSFIIEPHDENENDEDHSEFKIFSTIVHHEETDHYPVIVNNDSDHPILISSNNFLTSIKPCDNDLPAYELSHISVLNERCYVKDSFEFDQSFIGIQFCQSHKPITKEAALNSSKASKKKSSKPKTNEERSELSPQAHHDLEELDHTDKIAHSEAEKALSQKEHLNSFEKAEMLRMFKEKHYYPHTPTEMEENHSRGIVEIKDSSDSEFTYEQLVEQIDLSHLPDDIAAQVRILFLENSAVMATHEWDCPRTPLVTADLQLTEKAKTSCMNCRFIPIPAAARQEVQKAIDKMLKYGIVTKCHKGTNIVSNLLVVRKPNGKLRILLDSRLLNLATVKLPCALSDTNSIYEHFSRAKFVSSIDINQAFFSIGIKTSKIPLFSFFGPDRQRYAFARAAQGFKNSSFWMEALVTQVLSGIEDTLAYCDDIFICTKSEDFNDHLKTIDKVLKSLINARLKIQPAKIKINKPTMNILGLTFSRGKFSIPKARSQAINQIPTPKTLKETRSFVMMVSFFRRYIKNFAEITLPLTNLTKKDHRSFKWTPEADKSFNDLKNAVATSMELTPPDTTRPFYCSSDASNNCSAFLCWQEDDYGRQVYIGAHSRTFSKSERSYSIFKKEVLSCLMGFSAFDFVLRFAPEITLYIDARSILWLRSVKFSEPLLSRFALKLSMYNITIKHVPGAEHVLPDYLSRSLVPTTNDFKPMTPAQGDKLFELVTLPTSYAIDKELLKSYLNDEGLPDPINSRKKKKTSKATTINRDLMPLLKKERKIRIPRTTKIHPFYPEQFQQLQEEQTSYDDDTEFEENLDDEDISRMNSIRLINPDDALNQDEAIEKLRLNTSILSDGTISINTFRRAQISDPFTAGMLNSDTLPAGFIIRRGILIKITKGKERLVLPTLLIDALFSSHHFSILGKHKPISKLYEELSKLYYHPDLLSELKKRAKGCYLCLCQKKMKERRIPYGEKSYATTPRECWLVDIADGLPQSEGYSYVICFSCSFSLYTVLVPLKHKDAKSILEAFRTSIVKTFGIPKMLYSDNESALKSDLFQDFCNEYDIAIATCAPHSPFSNGVAETCVNLTKESIRLYHAQSRQTWPNLIPLITNALNKRLLSTGHTPEELLFGMNLETTDDIAQSVYTYDQKEYLEEFKSTLKKLHQKHAERREQQAITKRKYLNKTTAEREFYEDQLVLLRNFQIAEGKGTALLAPFIGPYVIVKIHENKVTALLQDLDSGKTRIAHLSHLKPVDNNLSTPPMPSTNKAQDLLKHDNDPEDSLPKFFQPRFSARIAARQSKE